MDILNILNEIDGQKKPSKTALFICLIMDTATLKF